MSKLAQGQNGETLGTSAYFAALNSNTLLAAFMADSSGYDWRGGLDRLASAAREVIDHIHGDLQMHEGVLRYIQRERRERVNELVTVLSGLCSLAGADNGRARECSSMLTLSGFTGMSRSMATDFELERAANIIHTGGSNGLDSFSRIYAIREAVQWGESFAIGSDERKRQFLQEIKQERASNTFLADAWDFYNYRENPGDYCGSNGCEFGSDSYVSALERELFPAAFGSNLIQTDYAAQIRSELQEIVRQIETDVTEAEKQKDFLPRENGDRLAEAVNNLNQCGITGSFGLVWQIEKLPQEAQQEHLQGHSVEEMAEILRMNLEAAGLGRQALAEMAKAQTPEDAGRADSVYGASLGAAVAWGVAISGTVFVVIDGYGNVGIGVTGGFGGGLGVNLTLPFDFKKGVKPGPGGLGTKFFGCDTIWDVEGMGAALNATLWFAGVGAAFGQNVEGEGTTAISAGGNQKGLGFQAVITGTKLLFTFNYKELF